MKNCVTLIFALIAPVCNLMAKHGNPTYATEIAKIIYTKCTNCHRQGNIAPFPLENYNQVLDNRFAIQFSVQKGSMPPWPPSSNYQRYAHERTLTEMEKEDIILWVNNGAPRGDVSLEPPPPVFSNEPIIGTPNQQFTIPTYTLKSNNDDYRCFTLPLNNAAETFLKAVEFLPDNKKVVHHILLFADSTKTCFNLDSLDPEPGYASFGGVGSNTAKLLQLWVPGQQPFIFPDGLGSRLAQNSYLILQVHYAPNFQGQKDSTSFLAKFDTGLRNLEIGAVLNHTTSLTDGPLFIPKNTKKTFHAQFTVPVKVTLTGIAPHMHLLGKEVKVFAVNLQGDTTPLIHIPEWDFHWQGLYTFKKPVILNPLTKIYGVVSYDNTTENPNNPNNPPKDVTVGEGTEDEMFLVYMNFMRYQTGDENIMLEDTTQIPNSTSEIEQDIGIAIVFPNPAKDKVLFTFPQHEASISIISMKGEIVLTKNQLSGEKLDISMLRQGIYMAIIETKDKKWIIKLVKE